MAKIESHMDADHAEIALIRTQLDNHLSIYANNGKELAAVKTNLSWLMKFFWIFMTPIAAGIVYLVIHK